MSRANARIGNVVAVPSIRAIGQQLAARAKENGKDPQPLTDSDKAYFGTLHTFISEIFSDAAHTHKLTWSQMAKMSGLSYQTVAKLGNRETKWPRFSTIAKLAFVVGWELSYGGGATKLKKSA